MTTLTNKLPNSMMWIAGIAVTLFCATGIAAIMGWLPTSIGHTGDVATAVTVTPATPVAVKPTAPVAKPHTATNPIPKANSAVAQCPECGLIESTREVSTAGEGTGIGAVGGAVIGGLLGNQVGGGQGKQLATVVGAVGGVIAGNEIEKRVNATKSYEVAVHMDNGTTRVISQATAPAWRPGDHVRVVNGVIVSK